MLLRKGDWRFRVKVARYIVEHYAPLNTEFTTAKVAWDVHDKNGRRVSVTQVVRALERMGMLARVRGTSRFPVYRVVNVAAVVAEIERIMTEPRLAQPALAVVSPSWEAVLASLGRIEARLTAMHKGEAYGPQ